MRSASVGLTIEDVGRVECGLLLLYNVHVESGAVTHFIIRVQLTPNNRSQRAIGQEINSHWSRDR